MRNTPILNVLITTYNLEDYIEQTLSSVLKQQTSYKYSIIIYDDASTDNTVKIIRNIQKNHPKGHVIELYIQETNKGVKGNTFDLFQLPSAPYIMFLDGDDWWIDDKKIEKQISFLESNLDYNVVLGNYKKFNQETCEIKEAKEWVEIKKELTLKDFLAYNFSQTSTFCYRNNFKVPDFFANTYANDQLQIILSSQDKKIKYLPDYLAMYRIHEKSNTHNVDHLKGYNDTKFFLASVNAYTNNKYYKLIKNRLRINETYLRWTTSNSIITKLYYKVKLLTLRLYAYKILSR